MEKNGDAYDKFVRGFSKLTFLVWSLSDNTGKSMDMDHIDGLFYHLQEIKHDLAAALDCDFYDRQK
jgi:hypothetical protein